MQVNIKLDTSSLLRWATDLSAYKIKLALKNGLNRAARAARKDAVADIAADANVPLARVKPGISKLRTASPGNLTASFDAKPLRIGILATGGATIAKGVGLHASTHRLSGGRSASLSAPKAFIKNAGGGRVVMVRTGKGRKALKGIFGENPASAMRQDNAFARQHWLKDAAAKVEREITADLTKVLNGGSPLSDSGSD